jgi:hypothetical protein
VKKLLISMAIFLFSSSAFSLNLPGFNEKERRMENEKYYKKTFKGQRLDIYITNKVFKTGSWYLNRNRKTCDYCDYAFPMAGEIKTSVWVRKVGNAYIMDGPQVFEIEKGKKYRLVLVENKWGRDNVEKDGKSILIYNPAFWYHLSLKEKSIKRSVRHDRDSLLKVTP